MICNSSLWKIISSYSFWSISCSYFAPSVFCILLHLSFVLSNSYILDLRIFNPFSLFLICDFSSCWLTTIPVGIWVILTAESVVFTLCPPGPLLLKTSILKSFSSIFTSTSSASGSTATVAADVWTLPCVSVSGTLWTLWTPLSYFKRE